MRITLLSPLFPPDTGTPASYVKELITRLPADSVDIAIYGNLPEYVAHTRYHCIDKRSILPVRLFRFTKTLYMLAKQTDVFLVQNGPSVELPVLLISYITPTPIVLCISDPRAAQAVTHKKIYGIIHRMVCKRVQRVISIIDHNDTAAQIPIPMERPEILPTANAQNTLTEFEISWNAHVTALLNTLQHVST